MATFDRFEDIKAWQDARDVVREVYRLTSQGSFARDFGLRDQLRRAGVSIMSNIAEGFEHDSSKEFRRYLYLAKASAGEVRSLLYVSCNTGYIDAETQHQLTEKNIAVSRQIAGLIAYLSKHIRSQG